MKNRKKTINDMVNSFSFEKDVPKTDGENEILQWIETHGIEKKNECGEHKKHTDFQRGKRYRRNGAWEQSIDLHGFTLADAEQKLRSAFEQFRREGVMQLFIIHGKGTHSGGRECIIKDLVYQLLRNDFRHKVRSYQIASPREGGEGATRIYLL